MGINQSLQVKIKKAKSSKFLNSCYKNRSPHSTLVNTPITSAATIKTTKNFNFNDNLINNKGVEEEEDDDEDVFSNKFQNNKSELWESYFSSPISTILKLGGIEILDVGCGSAVWLMEMSTIYPHSKFTGIDKIKHHSMPSNIKFVQSDITDINNRFPFNEKIFDFIHISSFFITLPEKSCNITIFPELFRILKPGGWLEVCEYDGNLLPNFGPITKYFVDLLFSSLSNQGISIVSTGELLINLFEENNFKFYCDYKIVKRDEIDLAKAAFKNTFISFKHILIEFTPFSSQEYFDLLDEVDKEFFEYDSSLQMVRIYGQKPMKFMEVF